MDRLDLRAPVTAATPLLAPDNQPERSTGALPRLAVLYSYSYLRGSKDGVDELLASLSPHMDILIDSGAFTDFQMQRKAAARGTSYLPLRLDDYIAWLKDTGPLWWQYIMLDVIRNPEASRINLARMVKAGLRPMPVFTYPEKLEAVPELCAINEHLCVSGGTDAARSFMHQRFHRVYEASEGKAKIHGLAFVKYPDIYQLPLYSVDSSTWTAGKRFGTVHRYEPRLGMVGGPWQKTLAVKKDAATILHLRRCNITPDILRTRAKPHWDTNDGIAATVTTNAHLQFFRHAHSLGRHYFLAATCSYQLFEIAAVAATQHPSDGTFDYQKALELVHLMKRCWKSKAKREAVETCVQLVRDTTLWTQGRRV
jgi:hypothetical protein